MMVYVMLAEHKSVNWVRNTGLCFRGRYFDSTGYYENEDVLGFADEIQNESDFVARIAGNYEKGKGINGNYSVIFENDSLLLAAVDRISSFPLFYTVINEDLFVSDSISALRDRTKQTTINKKSLDEFRASGFVLGNRTMYENIHKLEAGQYLSWDKHTNSITINNYFEHLHMLHEQYEFSEDKLIEELDQVVLDVFSRMIESLNGRTVVLLLSGGYDSRLVALSLKRLNYKKVICVSFGSYETLQVSVARKVASELGYQWIFIKTDGAYWKNKRKDGSIQKRLSLASNQASYPYITGMVLEGLLEAGKIPHDSVAVTGLSGDVLEGNEASHAFLDGGNYSKTDIMAEVVKSYFLLNGYKKHSSSDFYPELNNYIQDKDFYSAEEADDFYELINWRLRQSQYVSDIRNYDDYLGLDWRLPLWDNAFVDFWLKVPYKLRYGRKLYYKYVEHDNLPSANHTVSNVRKIVGWAKKTFGGMVRFGYPVKLTFQYIFGLPDWLCNLKILSFSEFCDVLRKTYGYKMQVGTAEVYLILRYYFGLDYFKD